MKTILIIIAVVVLIAGAVWVGTKFFGLTKDQDKDGIPDAVEDAVDDVKEAAAEVKRRAQNVKKELKDVVAEAKDVADALQGKVTKSKLNSLTKSQLIAAAKSEFDVELDSSLTKSNLVNKVYSLCLLYTSDAADE